MGMRNDQRPGRRRVGTAHQMDTGIVGGHRHHGKGDNRGKLRQVL
jgi:hypothetical protein